MNASHKKGTPGSFGKTPGHSNKSILAENIVNSGFWEWDSAAKALHLSENLYNILKIDRRTVNPSLDLLFSHIHADDKSRYETQFQTALENNTPLTINHRLITSDSMSKHAITHIDFRFEENHLPTRVIGLVQDISRAVEINDSINNIATGVSARIGKEFFPHLLTHLAGLFNASYAFIGLVDQKNPRRINTLSVYAHGQVAGNMTYELEGTPCANVIDQSPCAYPDAVQSLFPNDKLLQDMNAVSYIGAPLYDSESNTIGLIVIIDTKPMERLEWVSEILQIFSARVSAELERMKIHEELENRVLDRTAELDAINKELESFSYSVSHDLRTPLRAIDGFAHVLEEDCYHLLDETGKSYLSRIRSGCQRMGHLIDDLLKLASLSSHNMEINHLNLSHIAVECREIVQESYPDQTIKWIIQENLSANGDRKLLGFLLMNLLENACKYSSKNPDAQVQFGSTVEEGKQVFYVKDNGAGFDMAYYVKLFNPFQRLHGDSDYPGSGIGLATAERIVKRHKGTIWAKSSPGEGATFYFTLGT